MITTEVIVAFFTFLTASVGAVRYIMGYWIKQQMEVRHLEKRVYDTAINSLKAEMMSFKDTVRLHAHRLLEVDTRLAGIVKKLGDNQDNAQAVLESLREFIQSTNDRFAQGEKQFDEMLQKTKEDRSQIIALGRDLAMIKGKKTQ